MFGRRLACVWHVLHPVALDWRFVLSNHLARVWRVLPTPDDGRSVVEASLRPPCERLPAQQSLPQLPRALGSTHVFAAVA